MLPKIITTVASIVGVGCAALSAPTHPNRMNEMHVDHANGEQSDYKTYRLSHLVEIEHLSTHSAHHFAIVAERKTNLAINKHQIHYKWLDVETGAARPFGPVSLLRLRGYRVAPKPNGNEEILAPSWAPSGRKVAVHDIHNDSEAVVVAYRGKRGNIAERRIFNTQHNIIQIAWVTDTSVRVDERICVSDRAQKARRSALLTPAYVPYLHGLYSQRHVCDEWETRASIIAIEELRDSPANTKDKLPIHQVRLVSDLDEQGLSERRGISYQSNTDAEEWIYCELAPCRQGVVEAWRHGSSPDVLFLAVTGGNRQRQSMHAWNPENGSVRILVDDERKFYQCGQADTYSVCVSESPKYPPRVVKFKDANNIESMYEPNATLFRAESFRIQPMEWSDGYGNTAAGHLVYPVNFAPNQTYPLVVVQYRSRGFLRGGTGGEYPIFEIAAEGFFVLSFDRPDDHRLEQSVKSNTDLIRAEWADLYKRKRVLNALNIKIDELVERGLVDKKRIAITGLSDGADTVNYALTHSKLFSCAIVSGGLWSPSSYHLMSRSAQSVNTLRGFGHPDSDDGWNWANISPALNLDVFKAPLLVNDSDAEFLLSIESYRAIEQSGLAIEVHTYRDEFHVKRKPTNLAEIRQRNIDWLRFWLLNKEVDSASEPNQYVRWRLMRNVHCTKLRDEKEGIPHYCH